MAINAFAGLDNNRNASDFQVKEILTIKSEEKTCFYIINFKPTGFIILSASDAAVPILGSSTDSNFSFENIPPQLAYLFDSYKAQIKEIEKQKIAPTKEIKHNWDKYIETTGITSNSLKSASTVLTQVGPLVPTSWNQNDGWNQRCPIDANSLPDCGGRVPAGCGAVALAQILHYWGCRVSESGNYSINSAYGTLSADFTEADYQWSSMSPSSPDNYNAKLIFDCGIAINTQYGPEGSSCASVDYVKNALKNYFGFKDIANDYYSNEYTDLEWKNLLKSDLNLGRPIFYTGYDDIAPNTSDHAWIIDGYNSLDQFHCNWGWGGSWNKFYYLNNLNPYIYVYAGNFVAILNIEPIMSNCGVGINGVSTICSAGASFNVPSSSLPSGATITWQKSDNLTMVSPQSANPCTFQANGTGAGWIEATVHNNGIATLDRKDVWVGAPLAPTDIQFFPHTPCLNQDIIALVSSENPSIAGVHYEWSGGSHNYIDYSPSGSEVHFLTLPSFPYTSNVYVRSTNECDFSSEYSELLTVKKCGGGIPPAPAIAYPNPASTEIEITIGEESSANQISGISSTLGNGVYDISVLNSLGITAYKGKVKGGKIKISVLGWQKGLYHYGISKQDQTVSGTFIVE